MGAARGLRPARCARRARALWLVVRYPPTRAHQASLSFDTSVTNDCARVRTDDSSVRAMDGSSPADPAPGEAFPSARPVVIVSPRPACVFESCRFLLDGVGTKPVERRRALVVTRTTERVPLAEAWWVIAVSVHFGLSAALPDEPSASRERQLFCRSGAGAGAGIALRAGRFVVLVLIAPTVG